MTTIASQIVPAVWSWELAIRQEEDGPEFARAPVPPDTTLADLVAEVWRDEWLRHGRTEMPLARLVGTFTPLLSGGGPRCEGVRLEVTGSDGRRALRSYDNEVFRDAATALAHREIAAGRMKSDSSFYFTVQARTLPAAPIAPAAEPGFRIDATIEELQVERRPMAPLLWQAEQVGEVDGQMNVFYVRRALENAERFSRRGAANDPPRESGAALLGVLGSCPESGELYLVVTDALEAVAADQQPFSLQYSGETWARLQVVLRARRSRAGGAALRFAGQSHGHNFPPPGGPPCELCAKVRVCSRTSVFPSSDDRRWMQAVMSGQPWQLCHIFGLNARNDPVATLYGLSGNRLIGRGYHVIEEFPLDASD